MEPPTLRLTGPPHLRKQLKSVASWVLNSDLDLGPFYDLTRTHPGIGPIVQQLRGLKPLRPESLFEMMVTAIIEQQISLRVAYAIRRRVVERFGDEIDGVSVFPEEKALARSTLEQLRACGLSARKSEYIRDLSKSIVAGQLDLGRLKVLPDDEIREELLKIRGFGPWSVEYILVRGLGRPDCVPVDDLAVRTVVGKLLGDGERVTPNDVSELLRPFSGYRGIAAFYLLAADRLAGHV
jgi:DNA-3-methyladenine glycosylase II